MCVANLAQGAGDSHPRDTGTGPVGGAPPGWEGLVTFPKADLDWGLLPLGLLPLALNVVWRWLCQDSTAGSRAGPTLRTDSRCLRPVADLEGVPAALHSPSQSQGGSADTTPGSWAPSGLRAWGPGLHVPPAADRPGGPAWGAVPRAGGGGCQHGTDARLDPTSPKEAPLLQLILRHFYC